MDTIRGHRVMQQYPTARTRCHDAGAIVLLHLQGEEASDRYTYCVGWVREGSDIWTQASYYGADEAWQAYRHYDHEVMREQTR